MSKKKIISSMYIFERFHVIVMFYFPPMMDFIGEQVDKIMFDYPRVSDVFSFQSNTHLQVNLKTFDNNG